MALELDDDAETLAAALALIDEWELSTYTVATAESSGESTPQAPPRPDASKNLAPAQQSRREELVFLRRKVKELEDLLDTLKEEQAESKDENTEPQLDAKWIWQQIAMRQLGLRQEAERENLRLRVQVEEQIQIARDLMRVLVRAHRRGESGEVAQNLGSFKRIKIPENAQTAVSEQEQLQRVADMLEESATVFTTAPFAGGPLVFRDVKVLEHANGETTMNINNAWVVPFPVDQVMAAFWVHLLYKSRNDGCDRDTCRLQRPDDGREQVVMRYESNARASKFSGKFYGRFFARRIHPEDDKPGVIVMDMCADPVGFTPLSMEGVRLHNVGILRFLRADQAAENEVRAHAGHMTLIQMSQRVHVQLAAAETPTRRRRVGALTEFLMYNVEAELDWKQNLLETLLLRSDSATPLTHDYWFR